MSDGKQVAVLLAPGFEEIEAVTVIDILRRAEFEVVVASVGSGSPVPGAHGLGVAADMALAGLDPTQLAAVVLPGGMPGAKNLAGSAGVGALLRAVYGAGGILAAICAAPIVLHAVGLLDGCRATCHPSVKDVLTGVKWTGTRVERDERILTSKGPGTSAEFAFALVRALGKPGLAEQLRLAMFMH